MLTEDDDAKQMMMMRSKNMGKPKGTLESEIRSVISVSEQRPPR